MNELETQLADLADHLAVPTGENLASRVRAGLAVAGQARRRRRRVLLLVGALAAGAGTAGLSPAMADLLGFGGVEIHQEPASTATTADPVAESTPPPTLPPLDLGERVSLDAVAARAGFEPLLPSALGTPEEVWVDERAAVPLVWLRWDGGPLITQLAAGMPEMPVIQKFAPEATIRWVRAGARPALWIEGVHELLVAEHRGETVVQRLRTSDSTLLLEIGALTIRVETTAGLEEALRIAASLGEPG